MYHRPLRLALRSILFVSLLLASSVSAAWAVASVPAPTVRHFLYIRVVYPDDPTVYITEEEANEQCRIMSDYYAENSYNKVRFTWTVTEPLMMPRSWQYYDQLKWITADPRPKIQVTPPAIVGDAMSIAAAAGYSSDYEFPVIHSKSLGLPSLGSPPPALNMVLLSEANDANTLAHEIGHWLGYVHSNAWETNTKGVIGARDWINNYRYGISEVVAYGDLWDTMGSGNLDHFSVPAKAGWIGAEHLWNITESGTYRVHAFDQGTLEAGKRYGFQVQKNGLQTYWGGFRDNQTTLPYANAQWLHHGLLLWMGAWDSQLESGAPVTPTDCLLDTTPYSQINQTIDRADGPLLIGRTYSDHQSGIHITPIRMVEDDPRAIDVVVNLGWFEDNHAPEVGLQTSVPIGNSKQIQLSPGSILRVRAQANDVDGDELAYYWDFGDGTIASSNSPDIEHRWTSDGLYTMRVEVSDMKGGVDSISVAVNVGLSEFPAFDPDSSGRKVFWGRGRIVDQDEQPVQGVRVWIRGSNPRIQTYSDGDGRFILAEVPADDEGVLLGLYKDGTRFLGRNAAQPYPDSAVLFGHGDLNTIDFTAYDWQVVRPELYLRDGTKVTDVTDEGLPVVPDTETSLVMRVYRQGPVPQGNSSDPDFIPDALNTQMHLRVYTYENNNVAFQGSPLTNPNHFSWQGEYEAAAAGTISDPRALYRRIESSHDNDHNQPFNVDNPIDRSVQFALGGLGNGNLAIPTTYNQQNPDTSWPWTTSTYSANNAALETRRTSHIEHLRQFVLSGGADHIVDTTDPTNIVRSTSPEIDNNGFKIGPWEGYLMFHKQTDCTFYNNAVAANEDYHRDETAGDGWLTGIQELQPHYVDMLFEVADVPAHSTVNILIPHGLDYWCARDQLTFVIRDTHGTTPTNVNVFVSDASDNEDPATAGAFTFSRTGPVDKPVTVHFTVNNITAVEGVDFETLPRQITIPAEEREALLPLVAIDNLTADGTRIFQVEILADGAYANTDTGTGSIHDNEKPQVHVHVTRHAWERANSEGSPVPGEFTFTRYGNLEQQMRVYFEWIAPGDVDAPAHVATPGTDYDDSQSYVDFEPWVTSVRITVAPIADGITEGDELIAIRLLSNASYNLMEPMRATCVLHDAEVPTVSVQAVGPTSANEPGSLTFRFVRQGALSKEFQAFYTLTGTADYGDDYTIDDASISVGEIIFLAGETQVDVPLEVLQDDYREPNEDIIINLIRDPTPALTDSQNSYNINPDTNSLRLQINANDGGGPLAVAFTNPMTEVMEGDTGDLVTYIGADVEITYKPTGEHDFSNSNINAYDNLLMVDWEVVRGAPPGETEADPGIDFDLHDSYLAGADGVGIDFGSGTPTPEPEIVDGGTIYFKLNPNGNADSNTRISSPRLSDTGARGTGQVSFTVHGNDTVEGDRYFRINLKRFRFYNTTNPAIRIPALAITPDRQSPAIHFVKIIDDDQGDFSLTGIKTTLDEAIAGDTAQIEIVRAGSSSGEVTVSLSMAGTASAQADFLHPVDVDTGQTLAWHTITDGQDDTWYEITFADGETSKVIEFTVVDDAVIEPTETATIRLAQAPGGKIDNTPVTLTIFDDDDFTLPQVSMGFIDQADQYATEGGDPARLTLTRTDTDGELMVHLAIGSLSSATPDDYTGISNNSSVSFGDGVASVTIEITAVDDGLVEGVETLLVALINAGDYEIGEPSGRTIYLIDNDGPPPVVTLSQLDDSIIENRPDAPARVLLRREGQTRTPLDVLWTISDAGNAATIGSDYKLVDYQGNEYTSDAGITIPAGVSDLWLHVVPIDDSIAEGEEGIGISLLDDPRYEVGAVDNSISITLIDDDLPTIRIEATTAAIAEGGNLVYTLTRSGGDQSVPLTVDLSLGSGTATVLDDFTDPGSSATIPADASSVAVNVVTINDSIEEDDETVILAIDANAAYLIAPTGGSATGTILDNDRARIRVDSSLTIKKAYENHPTLGTVNGQFTLKRDNTTTGEVTVRFRMSGSARLVDDYAEVREAGQNYGEAVFAAGADTVEVDILVVDDDVIESIETVGLRIVAYSGGGYNIDADNDRDTLEIISDDVTTVIVHANSTYAKFGMAPAVFWRLTRLGSTDTPLRVNVTTASPGTTAAAGLDFNTVGVSVDFAAGEKFVDVPLSLRREGAARRAVELQVTDPTRAGSYAPGTPSASLITILADNEIGVQMTVEDDLAMEVDGDTGQFRAIVAGTLGSDLTVPLDLDEGTATEVDDFVWNPDIGGSLDFSFGGQTHTFRVEPLDDGIDEDPETVIARIVPNEPSYFIIGNRSLVEGYTDIIPEPAVTIVDAPRRSIELWVYDEFGNAIPTIDYFPVVIPDQGTVTQESGSYIFEGLRSTVLYEFLMDQSSFGWRKLVDLIGFGKGEG